MRDNEMIGGIMVEYTRRRNINRGYMKLDVWNEAVGLFRWLITLLGEVEVNDFKLRSQIINAAQSISSNIAEGYCRTSIREYLQFINIALGSSGELYTRMVGLKETGRVSQSSFEEFDLVHYSMENKLLALKKSLQVKQRLGTWVESL